jgi:serine protease Do
MNGSTLRRVSLLSGVLGAGILAGLVLAGSWNVTPSSLASTSEPAAALAAPSTRPVVSGREVPEILSRPGGAADQVAQGQALPSLREAAALVRPAVVSVNVEVWQENPNRTLRMNIPEEFRDMFRFPQQEEGPQRMQGQGSGFILTDDGYILTNNHVVEGASKVTVTLPDKRQFEAKVVGADDLTDVAVIKIEAREKLPTVMLGDSDGVQIGDWVLAIGNPLEFDFTVTAGIVSARGRGGLQLGPTQAGVNQMIQDYIQTDAAINRGNSGGPLVDVRGRVVGINSAIASQTGYYQGYGFAVPIGLAKSVADDLIRYGEVKRAWIGILFHEVDAPIALAVSLPGGTPYGAWVESVTPGAPADKAGIKENDIILEIDGQRIDNSGQLQTMVSTSKPGTRLPMKVYRGGNSRRSGSTLEVTVRLEERPKETSAASPEQTRETGDKLGLQVRELTRQDHRNLDFEEEGVLVTGVETYGPAYDANIGSGLVIVEIDGEKVPDVKAYERIVHSLKSGSTVMVRIYVNNPDASPETRYTSIPVEVR